MPEESLDENWKNPKITMIERFLQHPTNYLNKDKFVDFCLKKTTFTGGDEDLVLRKDLIEAFEKHSGVSFLPSMCIGKHLVAAGVRVIRLTHHYARENCYVGIRLRDGEGRWFAEFMNRGRNYVSRVREAATREGIRWVTANRSSVTASTSSPLSTPLEVSAASSSPRAPDMRKRDQKSPHKTSPFPFTTSSSSSRARGTPNPFPLEAVTSSSASFIPLEESTAPSPQATRKGKRLKKTPFKPRSFTSNTSTKSPQAPSERKQDTTTIPKILTHLCQTGVKVKRLRERRNTNLDCMRGSVDCPGCKVATKGQPKTRERKPKGGRKEKRVGRTKNTSNELRSDRTSASTSRPLLQVSSDSTHPPDLGTSGMSTPRPTPLHHPDNTHPHHPPMSPFTAHINLPLPPPVHFKPQTPTSSQINLPLPPPAHTSLPPPPPAHTKPWTPTVTHINLKQPPPAHSKPREPMLTNTNFPPPLSKPIVPM